MAVKNEQARQWLKRFEDLLRALYSTQPALVSGPRQKGISLNPPARQYPANWQEWEGNVRAQIMDFRKANPQPPGLPSREARRLNRDIQRMLDPIADIEREVTPEALAADQEARARFCSRKREA